MYSVGWLVAYITVLLVIAEPCRNIGKYTLSDILAYRNDPRATRIVGAISVITVSTFYLTAQMVGGGVLVKTLIGIDYEISVIAVGVLMLALRAVRRHGRDDLGADHQGRPARDRVDRAGHLVWLPYGFFAAGFPRQTSWPIPRCRRGSRSSWATARRT